MAADEWPRSAQSADAQPQETVPGQDENVSPRPKDESPAIEESMEERLERLGRQRPEVFSSLTAEIGFVFSVCMSQVFGVSSHARTLSMMTILTIIGILCIWLHSNSTDTR